MTTLQNSCAACGHSLGATAQKGHSKVTPPSHKVRAGQTARRTVPTATVPPGCQCLHSGVGSATRPPHPGLRNAGTGPARGEGQTKPSPRGPSVESRVACASSPQRPCAPRPPTACDGPLRQHGLRPPLGGGSLFSLSQGSRSGDPPGEALKLFTIAVLGGQFFSFTAAYPEPGMISDTYGTLSISIC